MSRPMLAPKRSNAITKSGKSYTYFRRGAGTGPLRWPTPSTSPPFDRTLVRVRNVGTISSTAASIISTQFPASACTGALDWASYQATYDGFAVYGIRVKFFTAVPGADARDLTRGNLCSYIDMDTNTAVATVALAYTYSSAIIHVPLAAPNNTITRTVWIPAERRPKVNATSAGFSTINDDTTICFVGDGFGASTLYFYYTVEWFIEFTNQR